jgi:cellulose synthase/poly-beta-1,6-N-acetylglucosamine synthase-like glycosyltransferase
VIIPAYNEGGNISNALKSIFKSNYPKDKMEVIVVDDGSTDNTAKIAKEFPIKLVSYKQNKGKVFALNKGIAAAKNDIIITTDADTNFEPQSIGLLVKHFKDKRVGAVAGVYKAKSLNPVKNIFKFIFEKIQALEYLGFILIRKQQEMLNAILVVPGSIAAYRKDALLKVGGFTDDTVIEDHDMTIKMHNAGYKVKCDKDAMAWVTAPQTLGALLRERIRWYRGGFQVIKKNKSMFRNRLGAITGIWAADIFGMLLQFTVLGLVMTKLAYYLMNYPIDVLLLNLRMLLTHLLSLQFNFFDTFSLLTMALMIVSFMNMTISIKLSNDSLIKLFLYPVIMVYSSFLFAIFLKSFYDEFIKKKPISWLGLMKAEIS